MVICFLDLLVYGFPTISLTFFFLCNLLLKKQGHSSGRVFLVPCILPAASPSHHLTLSSSTLCISCKLVVGTRAVVLNRDCTLESRGELLKKRFFPGPTPTSPIGISGSGVQASVSQREKHCSARGLLRLRFRLLPRAFHRIGL